MYSPHKISRLALFLTAALGGCVATNPPTAENSSQTQQETAKAKPAEPSMSCQPVGALIQAPTPASTTKKPVAETSSSKKSSDKKPVTPEPKVAEQKAPEQGPCASGFVQIPNKEIPAKDLLLELRSLRTSFSGPNPLQSLDTLFAPPGQQVAAGKTGKPLASQANGNKTNNANDTLAVPEGSTMGSVLTDLILDKLIAELSYSAIDYFFSQLTDNQDVLSQISVSLPDTSRLAPPIRKQVLSMAAYMAAIKGSGRMIDASLKDMDAAKNSYMKAIEIRQNAVKLLGEALVAQSGLEASEREGQKRGTDFLTDPSQKALLVSLSGKRPEDLLNDFEAQNVALAYVKTRNPDLYKNYSIEVEQIKTHYAAYARTMAGAGSMLGFSALFLKKSKKMFDKYGAASASLIQPLAIQGLMEIVSLAPRIKKTYDASDDIVDGSFKIRFEGEEKPRKSQLTAKKALDSLDGDAVMLYKDNILNPQGTGLIYSLYKRSPKQAGVIMDHLTSKDGRNELTKNYLKLEDATDFSFQNAFEGKLGLSNVEKKKLSSELLGSPLKSEQPDESDKALIKLQEEMRGNLGNYSNADLRKLMFSMPQQSNMNPIIKLGKTMIQIDAPGIAGLAEYDDIAGTNLAQATNRKYKKDEIEPKRKTFAEMMDGQVIDAVLSAATTRQVSRGGRNEQAYDDQDERGERGRGRGNKGNNGNHGNKKHDH